jgi:formylglycine-generating enzyme
MNVVKPNSQSASPPTRTDDAFASNRVGQTRDDNSLKTTLVWIPPGDFMMGSPKDEKGRGENENQAQVTVTNGFWLGQDEVTETERQQVMQTTAWRGRGSVKEGDNYPATYVSWDDATKFCQKLTERERHADRLFADGRYRLLTEAQWEYACRAGSRSRFSFGDHDSDLGEYAWFNKNALGGDERYAHLVGQKTANPWGSFDMHGNVWEWCRDRIANELPGGRDPEVSTGSAYRVLRGGSWSDTADNCQSAYRGQGSPDFESYDLGFRVAEFVCEVTGGQERAGGAGSAGPEDRPSALHPMSDGPQPFLWKSRLRSPTMIPVTNLWNPLSRSMFSASSLRSSGDICSTSKTDRMAPLADFWEMD